MPAATTNGTTANGPTANGQDNATAAAVATSAPAEPSTGAATEKKEQGPCGLPFKCAIL